MKRKKYVVTIEIGVFWEGPKYVIGKYRWLWWAKLAAVFHLYYWPYRRAIITHE